MNRLIVFSATFALIAPLQAQFNLSDVFARNPASPLVQEGFLSSQVVKGKPFSATEERHSLQVLGDGTRIENTQTNRLYRDSEGRTRTEVMNGKIDIYDPVTHTGIELDPGTKTARKSNNKFFYFGSSSSAQGSYVLTTPWTTDIRGPVPGGNSASVQGVMAETTERLPTQQLNGVNAQGIRTTMTIPKGQIGNNRDIKIMTERWFSDDLQMLVKSENSDPRFGDTTYQLDKIVQSEPDASLFQIPSDYKVTDQPSQVFVGPKVGFRAGKPATKAPVTVPPAKNQ